MTHYDVIIIGSGAGGGTLAYQLAPSGKEILIVERGDYVRREKDNWSSRAVNVEAKYHTKEVWQDRDGNPLHPHTNYYVGGNTKFYGAALFRLRREDFGELRHHGGVSPEWPISYADLEPYYTKAEHLYQVHGERGVDPTDPWASAPYRYPAVRHEPRIQRLSDDLARHGLKPFHVPLGIMLDEANPSKSRCIRCDTCDGFACLVHAKSDAQVVCVDPALEHPNVSLMTNAKVARLLTSTSGREVVGVEVERGLSKEREVIAGDIVVSSCGAINSAALLLRSANDQEARGAAAASRHAPASRPAEPLRRQPHSAGRRRAPERDRAFRSRSPDVRARYELQGARGRQPVCRRRQLLSFERRRESGIDHHGQRHPRGRPPPRPTGRTPDRRRDGRRMNR